MRNVRKFITAPPQSDCRIDYDALEKVLSEYEHKLSEAENDLSLANKNIRDALVEQPSFAAYYDQIKVELASIIDYIDAIIDQRSGHINMIFKENSNYDHSDTSIKRMIGKDDLILIYKQMRMDVKELHDKAASVSSQFRDRTYVLTNLVKIMLASMDDVVLTKEDER